MITVGIERWPKLGWYKYVQNTINVGTNPNGDANIAIAGGTSSPYISIGQGTKGYNNTGVFIGSDGTNGKLSLKSATNSLLWDGTSLTVNGGGTFTGELSIGSGNTIFKANTTDGISLGHATFASAPFRVTQAGALTATSGNIGGWDIDSNRIFKSSAFGSVELQSNNRKLLFTGDGSITFTGTGMISFLAPVNGLGGGINIENI